jgi:two-component system, sensor histidine kinase and response regulator
VIQSVLIVDDERDIRDSLKEILEEEGYAVSVAHNGREALALLPSLSRPCVAILDIIMPVMSGTELYAAMQADPALATIPVLISTSDPSRAPPGTLIMKKPISLDRLLETIKLLFK